MISAALILLGAVSMPFAPRPEGRAAAALGPEIISALR